ncbi:LacI family transcriptional regulator [Pleomorphomonas diazotrophica]|uniref:LacI family transcriptional regulator n=1 Tax=Pleomorphomonas diazotrophica TaxID=1166257 RepID=A0A1I4ST10_9HYPH|nr:LacI family DNA-binding transcriptional regulator [Pleomorphomonas diazotrophica]PKR88513.1 LacI family transcriptional regulator [Pleomorphomonas diazotrophica]SFM67551.1 DNA-binding transcriptional regulator, LacI/PurR family [Pleomorphomonas diazotrophica]
MKVGVRDIAREAGVAVSTVSHVLNGTASISREVRDRVLAAARELGYLDQRRAKATIATMERVVVALSRDFETTGDAAFRNRALLQGLKQECERRSLKITTCMSGDAGFDVGKLEEMARAEKARGVIVMSSGGRLDLGGLVKSGLSLVIMNGEEQLRRADAVVPANAFAAGAALRYLADAGHSRVLMLGTTCRDHLAARRAGFAEAIETLGLTAAEALVASDDSVEAGEAAVALRLSETGGLDGATAISCLSDPLAEGALKALAAAGLKVPADISVIGCDGVRETQPAELATVRLGYDDLARSALAIMESRLMVPKPVRSCILVEFGAELISGATVGPPPNAPTRRSGGGAASTDSTRYRRSVGGGEPDAGLVFNRFH